MWSDSPPTISKFLRAILFWPYELRIFLATTLTNNAPVFPVSPPRYILIEYSTRLSLSLSLFGWRGFERERQRVQFGMIYLVSNRACRYLSY